MFDARLPQKQVGGRGRTAVDMNPPALVKNRVVQMRYTVPLGGHAEGSYRVRDINPLQLLAGHKSAAFDPLHTVGEVNLLQTETAGESVAGDFPDGFGKMD